MTHLFNLFSRFPDELLTFCFISTMTEKGQTALEYLPFRCKQHLDWSLKSMNFELLATWF